MTKSVFFLHNPFFRPPSHYHFKTTKGTVVTSEKYVESCKNLSYRGAKKLAKKTDSISRPFTVSIRAKVTTTMCMPLPARMINKLRKLIPVRFAGNHLGCASATDESIAEHRGKRKIQ